MNPILQDSKATKYFDNLPEYETWSGDKPVPSVGDYVEINFNNLGGGKVHCYFVEYGYLGCVVELDTPPQWFLNKNNNANFALIFGVDLV